MNPYHHLVSEYARFMREGKAYPLGGFPNCPRPQVTPDAPKVLIFSPHPDDEVITGGVALRLLREAKWNVINVAVTQGRKKERQEERFAELKACCECIGYDLVQTAPRGLENVEVRERQQEPERWAQKVKVIANLLAQHRPRVILFPHEEDWNSTHIGTHYLVTDALKTMPADFTCHTVETEFWGAMRTPNLMVEISPADLGDMLTALSFHVGEVRRNPYHLLVPAWMQDSVLHGSELVGGQGASAADFTFGTLYRLRRWQQGRLEKFYEGGRQISRSVSMAEVFS